MDRIVIGSSALSRWLQRRRIVCASAMLLASTGCTWLDERQRRLALRGHSLLHSEAEALYRSTFGALARTPAGA